MIQKVLMIDHQFPIEQMIHKWREEGATVNSPATSEQIEDFERKHSVRIPEDMRSYLSYANGMEPVDKSEFCFWKLEEFELLSMKRTEQTGTAQLYCFADWCVCAVAYFIELGPDTSIPNRVFAIDGPGCVANSFSAFVSKYLSDPDVLY